MSSSVEKRHQTIGEEGSRPSGRNFVIPIAVRRAETPFETGFAAFAILFRFFETSICRFVYLQRWRGGVAFPLAFGRQGRRRRRHDEV